MDPTSEESPMMAWYWENVWPVENPLDYLEIEEGSSEEEQEEPQEEEQEESQDA